MTPGLPNRLHQCLSDFISGLTDQRPLGVAVSGGSDSMGLLCGLASLLPPRRLVALTVDHGLRDGSTDEARRVKSRSRRLGVCHETLTWESAKPAAGIQAAARAARYRLLGAAAARLGLSAVLTAHTLNDQAETLAMRRARSLSDAAPGLAGISPATLFDGRMWVLRPLLGLQRTEIRDFLRDARIDWIEDPSNSDERFERVRVRALLADTASDGFNAGSEHIAVARRRLAASAAAYIDAHCRLETGDTVRVQCRKGQDPAVLATVIEALIDLCGGSARPMDRRGKATLEAIVGVCVDGGGGDGRAVTLGRALLRHKGPDLLIRRERRGIDELMLEPGAMGVWDGRFRVRNLDRSTVLTISGGGAEGVSPLFSRDLDGRVQGWDGEDGVPGGFLTQRVAGRSSRILPMSEVPLAQALARLAKSDPLPACPWAILTGYSGLPPIKVQGQRLPAALATT